MSYSLPTSIKIRDNEFQIREKGDFRIILECFSALNDAELTEEERVISSLFIFYEQIECYDDIYELFPTQEDLTEAVTQMYNFFNCNQQQVGAKQNYKLVDWDKDEQVICAAINTVANTEIRAVPYCHWWTFMGYYCSVGESTFSTIISIRNKIAKGKKLEKYEKEFKKDNPEFFMIDYRTTSQMEEDARIRKMFEGK